MPPVPETGDLVKVIGQAHHVEATHTGVVVRRVYSWLTMADSFVIQLSDNKRIHAPREDIVIMSKA